MLYAPLLQPPHPYRSALVQVMLLNISIGRKSWGAALYTQIHLHQPRVGRKAELCAPDPIVLARVPDLLSANVVVPSSLAVSQHPLPLRATPPFSPSQPLTPPLITASISTGTLTVPCVGRAPSWQLPKIITRSVGATPEHCHRRYSQYTLITPAVIKVLELESGGNGEEGTFAVMAC